MHAYIRSYKYRILFNSAVVSNGTASLIIRSDFFALKICILESSSSFQVQSNDVKCFQAVKKISPLFSTTLKNYSRVSNNTGPLIIPPKI